MEGGGCHIGGGGCSTFASLDADFPHGYMSVCLVLTIEVYVWNHSSVVSSIIAIYSASNVVKLIHNLGFERDL